jgi:hypothetical protein
MALTVDPTNATTAAKNAARQTKAQILAVGATSSAARGSLREIESIVRANKCDGVRDMLTTMAADEQRLYVQLPRRVGKVKLPAPAAMLVHGASPAEIAEARERKAQAAARAPTPPPPSGDEPSPKIRKRSVSQQAALAASFDFSADPLVRSLTESGRSQSPQTATSADATTPPRQQAATDDALVVSPAAGGASSPSRSAQRRGPARLPLDIHDVPADAATALRLLAKAPLPVRNAAPPASASPSRFQKVALPAAESSPRALAEAQARERVAKRLVKPGEKCPPREVFSPPKPEPPQVAADFVPACAAKTPAHVPPPAPAQRKAAEPLMRFSSSVPRPRTVAPRTVLPPRARPESAATANNDAVTEEAVSVAAAA